MSEYLYHHPEEYDLEVVAEHEFYEPDYSFDLCVVWRQKETGQLWTATDSGCSCPVPFEDHAFPTDFTEVRSIADLLGVMKAFLGDTPYRHPQPSAEFIRQVEEALND